VSSSNNDVHLEAAGFRDALRRRSSIVATFVLIPRIEVIELIAAAGFDAVIIDLEHGATSVAELPALVAAAHASRLFALVRVSENSAVEIGRVLDVGADGILVPHVTTLDDALRLVDAGRYPPVGGRSLNPYTRGNGYGRASGLYEDANRQIGLIAMLEGTDALESLETIAALEEVDAVFVGPMDLSGSLGFPGEPEHPAVVLAVQDVIERGRSLGCAVGTYAPTPDAAARWLGAGAALVALSADIAMVASGLNSTREAIGAATPERLTAG
jgi:4-hydroxy-2-oxoheptanedioate aldolase